VILNSVAEGSARIGNFSQADDCSTTVVCLQALGVEIEHGEGGELLVKGVGKEGLKEPEDVLNAENSATTMRILTGLVAAQPFMTVITGDRSLRSRPMDRVIKPLRLMGARIWGRYDDTRAPLVVQGGQLHGIRYQLLVASAQLKTALLIAGLFSQGDTIIQEPMPSRDHTERLLKAMGAEIGVSGNTIRLSPGSLNAIDLTIPGDISSAAFWLVAGAIHHRARIKLLDSGVNTTRTGIIDVLHMMGADLTVSNERILSGEPVADLEVRSSSLKGVEIGGQVIPRIIDEIPLVALAASVAQGKTVIRNAEELRVKEIDRISATVGELSKMGAEAEELTDGMVIYGGKKLRGANCNSRGDHRLAMMLGVAALIAEGETEIDNSEAADISYPTFWEDLKRLSDGQS
jgi:3-phosphoshikimate 1-carboxyvinyltransferase